MLWGRDHEVDGKLVRGVEMDARGDSRISNTAGGWRKGVPFGPHFPKADRRLDENPRVRNLGGRAVGRRKSSVHASSLSVDATHIGRSMVISCSDMLPNAPLFDGPN
jgi:hypothetical protein